MCDKTGGCTCRDVLCITSYDSIGGLNVNYRATRFKSWTYPVMIHAYDHQHKHSQDNRKTRTSFSRQLHYRQFQRQTG